MYLCKEEELCKDPERMGWKPDHMDEMEITWRKHELYKKKMELCSIVIVISMLRERLNY